MKFLGKFLFYSLLLILPISLFILFVKMPMDSVIKFLSYLFMITGAIFFIAVFVWASIEMWWFLYRMIKNGHIRNMLKACEKQTEEWKEFQNWKIKKYM